MGIPHDALETPAQDFWLSHLGEADNFNRWIFSRFAPWLRGYVLEVGCGTGNFTRMIATAGHPVFAVDIEPRYLEAAKSAMSALHNVTLAQMDVTKDKPGPEFDTVILLDVLEHIEDEQTLLRSLRSTLRDGGRLILKVPAHPFLYSSMDQAIGHHRRYTRESLRSALTSAGFLPDVIKPVNSLGVVGWWLNGKVLRRKTPPAVQIGTFDRIAPVVQAIETTLRLPIGLSYLALASKA